MQRGFLFVMSISDGSCLTVLVASSCDVGVVAYQMAVLVTRVGDVLTPACGPNCRPPPGMNAQRLAGGRSVIGVAVEHPARAGNRQHASRACLTGPGEAAP
jgi:hypothetical protein